MLIFEKRNLNLMGIIPILLLFVGLFFIIYNLSHNMGNFSKIVSYCWDNNAIGPYWNLVFKACFHIKAIYSSLIMAVISTMVFVIIAPIILIRGIFLKSKMERRLNSGEVFKYSDTNLNDQKFMYSNFREIGFGGFEPTATGNVKIDLALAAGYIDEYFRKQKTYVNLNVFQNYDLSNKMQALIPITIEKQEKVYPLYLIYNQEHKDSYNKMNPILKANNFENALYLSVIPMW